MVLSERIAVLRAGAVEQIAGPEALYEEPERSFVADFIGENNHLDGTVISVDGDFCEVEVSRERVRALRIVECKPGDRVTLSIRPERVAVNPDLGLYHNQVGGTIRDVAFVGDHLRVRMAACGISNLVAKIPNVAGHGGVLVGDTVRIAWTVTDCRALNFEPVQD